MDIYSFFHNSDIFKDNKYTKWYLELVAKIKSENRKRYKTSDTRYVYYEEHHILPRCIFPEYEKLSQNKWNGILLTAREHFLFHWLLTKIMKTEVLFKKMENALSMMQQDRHGGRILSAWQYERARLAVSISQKGKECFFKGKKRPDHSAKMKGRYIGKYVSDETRQLISENWHDSRESVTCKYCGKTMTKSMHTRWHGEKCKENPDRTEDFNVNPKLKGRKFSKEHCENLSKVRRGRDKGKTWYNDGIKQIMCFPGNEPEGFILGELLKNKTKNIGRVFYNDGENNYRFLEGQAPSHMVRGRLTKKKEKEK